MVLFLCINYKNYIRNLWLLTKNKISSKNNWQNYVSVVRSNYKIKFRTKRKWETKFYIQEEER